MFIRSNSYLRISENLITKSPPVAGLNSSSMCERLKSCRAKTSRGFVVLRSVLVNYPSKMRSLSIVNSSNGGGHNAEGVKEGKGRPAVSNVCLLRS